MSSRLAEIKQLEETINDKYSDLTLSPKDIQDRLLLVIASSRSLDSKLEEMERRGEQEDAVYSQFSDVVELIRHWLKTTKEREHDFIRNIPMEIRNQKVSLPC